MKVQNNNIGVSFKSTIRVVSPECFDIVCDKMKNSSKYENIDNWDIVPELINSTDNKYANAWQGFRINLDKGYTKGVRSCVAGVAPRFGRKASLFWHIENTRNNKENLHFLEEHFKKASNCILVGSKSRYDYSALIFNKLKNTILNNKIPITVMQDLENEWEAHLAYFSRGDVLYLAINKIRGDQNDYVKNLEELKSKFKLFAISKKDKLEFLNKENFLNQFGVSKISKALKLIK